jgi:hypothetical protein
MWLENPVTQLLRKRLLPQWVEEEKDRWAAGHFTDLSQFGTAILNAKAIGRCETLEDIISLDYESLCQELGYEREQIKPE